MKEEEDLQRIPPGERFIRTLLTTFSFQRIPALIAPEALVAVIPLFGIAGFSMPVAKARDLRRGGSGSRLPKRTTSRDTAIRHCFKFSMNTFTYSSSSLLQSMEQSKFCVLIGPFSSAPKTKGPVAFAARPFQKWILLWKIRVW
jgi:hypothetical protein